MLKVIDVVYEKGIFKPLEKVDLMEGERVKIKDRKIVAVRDCKEL